MTRFGPRIEPITSLTTGGCATSYTKDAGLANCWINLVILAVMLLILWWGVFKRKHRRSKMRQRVKINDMRSKLMVATVFFFTYTLVSFNIYKIIQTNKNNLSNWGNIVFYVIFSLRYDPSSVAGCCMYSKFSVKFVKYRVQVQPGSKRVFNDLFYDLQSFLPLTLPKQEFKSL